LELHFTIFAFGLKTKTRLSKKNYCIIGVEKVMNIWEFTLFKENE